MSHRRATPAKGAHALALLLTPAACDGNVQRPPSQLSAGISTTTTAPTAAVATAPAEMVLIKGGTFRMGADDEMPDESPAREVTLESSWIDRNEVTVGEFARFIEATGYTTEAERFGWAGVFDMSSGEWRRRERADWRHPEGLEAGAAATDEPVTQVFFADASAYARWAGKRLPTEAEWEYAARGGLRGGGTPGATSYDRRVSQPRIGGRVNFPNATRLKTASLRARPSAVSR